MQKNYSYHAGNYYMLRTPYLSAENFANADYGVKNNEILESILVSSRSLFDSINKHNVLDEKTKISLIKYQIRSTTRSTPFGLLFLSFIH